MEIYSKTVNIEGKTVVYMLKRQVIPAVLTYAGELAASANAIKTAGVDSAPQVSALTKINSLLGTLQVKTAALDAAIEAAHSVTGGVDQHAFAFRDKVLPAMVAARAVADELETLVDSDVWPLASYADLLFDR